MSVVHGDDRAVVLVRADEAERLGTDTSATRLLIDSEGSGGALSANRAILGPGADGPPPHYHTGSAEIFFVLDGELQALAGDGVIELAPGDFLAVPKSMPHAFGARPGSRADVLIAFVPAMTERFEYFRLVDRVLKGQADPQEILDNQERFDNHFLDIPLWQDTRRAQRETGV